MFVSHHLAHSQLVGIQELCPLDSTTTYLLDLAVMTTNGSLLANTPIPHACPRISTYKIQNASFVNRKVVSFTSSFITKDVDKKQQIRFIQNSDKVIIGEVLGDGLSFYMLNELYETPWVCMNVSTDSLNRTSLSSIGWVTLATLNSDGLAIQLNSTVFPTLNASLITNSGTPFCFYLTQNLSGVFPVGLVPSKT